MKIFYFLSISIFINYSILAESIDFSTKVNLPCQQSFPGGINTASVGDSRALQLAFAAPRGMGINNYIQEADLESGTKIVKSGQINLINRSVGGSQTRHWVEKIQSCRGAGQEFELPEYSVISLGGNDVLADIYKKKFELKDTYEKIFPPPKVNELLDFVFPVFAKLFKAAKALSLKNFVKNPFKTIKEFTNNVIQAFKTKPRKSISDTMSEFGALGFTGYWEWYMGSETDRVTNEMEYISRYILDQPNKKLALNTVQPVSYKSTNAPLQASLFIGYRSLDKADYPELLKLFTMLHSKYRYRLYPKLANDYGSNVALVDSFGYFLQNIYYGNSSYYSDGVHFTSGKLDDKQIGLERWGMFIAMAMVINGWVAANDVIDVQAFKTFLADIEASTAKLVLDLRSAQEGIVWSIIHTTEMNAEVFGFEKNYSGKAVFQKQGDFETYVVKGSILSRYGKEGGASGRLGYPITDEWSENFGTILKTAFECGEIHYNTLDLLHPDGFLYIKEDTEECKAKKARDAN